MAENYGSLEGVLDANETLEGEIDSHDEMSGEIQFTGGVGGVKDVQVNNESVVDANKVAHIDLTPYAEKEDVYDKDAVNTLLEGKADTEDIPTKLSQLDNDDNYVQDADYVHTDNNFTDEDKAAIGGIPENITDLSDVEVSNIQNGQVLKWDSTQEKFVNADESGGGSGDVADVKVNGTSVVDPVTKEANIDLSGYAETTDIHNPTITIQKNGQNVDTFSLNQTTNKIIDISVPTKTSDLQNDSSFITNTVNNLANYYLKSDTYTQTEVNNLISAAVNGRFEKVTTLPASGEPNVIYLVPKTTALTNNVYDEYIWQDNAWELLGSTEIDLSNYVTTTDLATALADYVTTSAFNTAIANYYTKTEVGNLLDEKVDKVSGKGLSTYDYDATAKGIVDSVTTNLAGKVDKVNGKGLSTEDYTTTEKNKLAGISTGANKVESSTTNGNIKIDGAETQVYDGSGKVDKVNGKGLSTNDYDNTDKAKVDMIDNTTTSATGNPISIADLKSAQIALNPVITFEPIQAGSGTPSPSNVRAISGYDKIEVLSCGKNILEGTILNASVDNSGVIMSAANNFSLHYARVGAGKTYTLTSNELFVGGFYLEKPSMGSVSYNGQRVADEPRTFTSPIDGYVVFRTAYSYTTPQLEEGSTSTSYESPHKTTDLSESLGQTVYGGTLDVRTGKLVSILKALDMSTMDWQYSSGLQLFYCYVSDIAQSNTMWCSCYNPSVQPITENYTITSRYGYYVENPAIVLKDTRYTDVTSLKNALTGQIVVYTAVESAYTNIQLTPHEIALSQGYNYISTNGTQIQLAYHNGELATHADVEQLSETVNDGLEFWKTEDSWQIFNSTQLGVSGVTLYAHGAMRILIFNQAPTGSSEGLITTLPAEHRPSQYVGAMALIQNGSEWRTGMVTALPSGKVTSIVFTPNTSTLSYANNMTVYRSQIVYYV